MAKIGLKNLLFGVLTEAQDGTATYGVATKPAKAISCSVEISNNEATLYADDALAESDTSFQSGTVTLGIDDEDLAIMATLLGHTITDGNMVRKSTDAAPYVGLGRIITKMVNGVYKYKVEFLCKVKFAEPSQEDNTKGESLQFGTSEIEGTVSALANGNWSIAQTFDSLTAAQTYLNSLFTAPTYTVTNNLTNVTTSNDATSVAEGASYTATLSGTLAGGSFESCTVTMGSTDITSTAVSGTDTKTITIASVTGNIVITAKYENAGQ